MRPNRTLAPGFALAAVLCVAVAVCADPTPTGTATPADTGRAADGGELAASTAGGGDTIFDPFTARLPLSISASGGLRPNAPVTLTISGEAQEAIDGGEVVFMLPTKAAMDHAGAGRTPFYPLGRTIPATASWRLSRMRKGDTWRRTVTVPGEAAGYYMAAVIADAHGPASALGPYLSDESYDQAWMLVSETGGRLTEVFEDSVFAEDAAPMPGPFTTVAELLALAQEADDEHEVMRVEVTYLDGAVRRAAVGVRVWAWLSTDGWDTTGAGMWRYVPESGIVEFPCPTERWPMYRGRMELPETRYVQGRDKWVNRWVAHRSQCHPTEVRSSLRGRAWTYLAWRNLSDAIPVINDRFGYERKRINWKIDRGRRRSYYYKGLRGWGEKIVFGENGWRSLWVAAHEYAHALHHRSMGGMWGLFGACWRVARPSYYLPTSYGCAFSEGLASYGGWVVSPNENGRSYEVETVRDTHKGKPTTPKPKVEAHIAALFNDLVDTVAWGPGGVERLEPEDKTTYPSRYVMDVFATCEVKYRQRGRPDWEKRNDVADFVWCLENRVDTALHDSTFPGIDPPHDSREDAREPSNWHPDSIRSTWKHNMRVEQ